MSAQEIFSHNLRNLLYLQNKKQADLARFTGASTATVTYWYNGRSMPKSKMLDKICEFLHCSLEDLTTDRTRTVEVAPEDILAEEMQNRPDLYRLFSIVMQMPSKDVELMLKLAERLSL